MEKPLISVIIPVYNVEKYLSACLHSICNQTLQSLEIILVDDGSTDGSSRIIDKYAAKDNRIRVVHKRNGNPGATRNVGVELVTGEYLGFVDSDDWIEPDMYEKLYQTARITQADLVVTGVCEEYINSRREVFHQLNQTITAKGSKELKDLFFLLSEKSLIAYPVNKLYRTDLIKKNNLRFPDMLQYEDLVFNLRFYMVINTVSLICGTPYHYMHRNDLSASGSFYPKFLDACKLTEDTFRIFFEHFQFPDDWVDTFLRKMRISNYSAHLERFYKRNCQLTRKERIFRIKEYLFDNTQLKQDLLLSPPPSGFYLKMFYFFVRYTTPDVIDSYYLSFFFLLDTCTPLYRKFRRLISK